jgi:kynureninase
MVIWDLSHAVGAIPINLKELNCKLAVGCTYKFLNGGPGSPAFIYIQKDLIKQYGNPIKAWLGHADPFSFNKDYTQNEGI